MPVCLLRTPEEVADLQARWLADPCWDLEETPGFEAHRETLLQFRQNAEAAWSAERAARLATRADALGCSFALAEYIEGLEARLQRADTRLEDALDRLAAARL